MKTLVYTFLLLFVFATAGYAEDSFVDTSWNAVIDGKIVGTVTLSGCTFSPCPIAGGDGFILNDVYAQAPWNVSDGIINIGDMFIGAANDKIIIGKAGDTIITFLRK